MRAVFPVLVLASLHASDAAQTCRLSLNVANIASPTQAPAVTTLSPLTTPKRNNGTNNTDSPMTTPASTTVAPGVSTTPLPTTLKPDKTTLVPSTTIAATTLAVPTTVAATTLAPTTTPKGASVGRVLKDATTPPTTTTDAPTTTPSSFGGKTVAPPTTTAIGGATTTSSKPPSTTLATATATSTFGTILCDETFYGLWAKKGITCGGAALDVSKVLDLDCKVYRGTLSLSNASSTGSAACFSSCSIPACINKKWDYTDSLGIDSSIYSDLTFSDWFGASSATLAPSLSAIATSSFKPTFSCEKYSMCQCPAAIIVSSDNSTAANGTKPDSGGTSGANDVWSDGSKKTNLDYAGQVTSSVSASITYTTIAATTTMVIASSVGVVSSSATAAAAGVSTAGSASTAGTTLDIAQFAVCTGALSLPGASNTLRLVATQMSFSTFTWFSFGDYDKSANRRLVEEYLGPREEDKGGMFEYTSRMGIKPQMLMYVTLAGVASVLGGVGILLILVLLVGNNLSCVKDKVAFRQDCLDRAIGALVLVAVISQYALGMVCMFQICLTLKNSRGAIVTAELFVAIATLLILAIGIIVYGLHVVRSNQEQIQDIGTAAHFDKTIHKRFGTLYDQYTFENRYFFVAKMSLALLSGMVTGTFAITGKTQLILLISMHVAFFLLLEVRKPHSAKFVQNTSVMIVILKVVVFGLSFFLLTAATENLPWAVQNVVSYVILALQLVVLLCLLVRQIYIFWKTRQIKNQKDEGGAVADEFTPPHLQLHAFDSMPASMKQGQREWTSEYYSDQNCRAAHIPPRQPYQQTSSLREIRPAPGHVSGKRADDRHDPNEYAI